MRAFPTDPKTLTSVVAKIDRIKLLPGERLCMVDSGSFTHAINAKQDLPLHTVVPLPPDAPCQDAESACGGVMKQFGKVKTHGTVDGHSLNVKWTAMDVKVPILSVRKLVRDNHNVKFNKHGGYIVNLATRERIPFFAFQGVYYLKMKFSPPENHVPSSLDAEPVFSRRVA